MARRTRATTSLIPQSEGDAAPGEEAAGQIHRLFDDAHDMFTKGRMDLDRRLDASPATVIAGAVAVGFIAGGGIFTPATGRLFGWTVRLAALVSTVRGYLVSNTN